MQEYLHSHEIHDALHTVLCLAVSLSAEIREWERNLELTDLTIIKCLNR